MNDQMDERLNERRAEYVRRVNRTMDYIEAHLSEPLPLERLADVACFSRYHFHRVFYAQVGETPGQFIQRLRLEKAARLLMTHRTQPVTDIAFECGFSDTAAFSRAFRLVWGSSPTAFRNLSTADSNGGTAAPAAERYDGVMTSVPRRNDMSHLETAPIAARNVQVLDRPEITLAYVRHTGPYFGDELLFQRLFTTLFTWAGPRDLIRRGETETIIIYHDNPETVAPEKHRISCCIPVAPEQEVSGEVGKLTLPAARYAEAQFRLNAQQFAGAWNWVFGVWMPESGYQPADGLCYERYRDAEPEAELDGSTGHDFDVTICVPVVPL